MIANQNQTKNTTTLIDLNILRSEFSLLDKTDPTHLRKWFDKYQYLSTNDHALIIQKSAAYVRRLKRTAGITTHKPKSTPNNQIFKSVNAIDVPNDWDDPLWLSQVINIYSIKAIAKACNVSRRTILRRIEKYSLIKKKRRRSTNKNCDWDWCNKHYTILGWSQAKCALKAGVSQQTFANWLNYLQIPVRTSAQTIKRHCNVRLWVKKLIYDLEQQSIVHKVYLRSNHIHVRFTNYFWETYYLDPQTGPRRPPYSYHISNSDAVIQSIPPVLSEYENDTFEADRDKNGLLLQPHIIINRHHLNQASLLEQRLAVHEYCRQVTQRGWKWPEYPTNVLQAELSKMQDYDPAKYFHNNVFSIYANHGTSPAPGRRIIEHFFDMSEYSAVFNSPRLVLKMLNILLSRSDLKFNTHNMLRIFASGACGLNLNKPSYRLFDPVAYSVIFKKLGITGSILDITPGNGNRTIAAALNGLKYYTIPTNKFNLALERGLAQFCNLIYEPWNGQPIDLLLLDNDFQEPDMSILESFTKYAKRMLVFVPNHLKAQYQSTYNPDSLIQIRTKWYQKSPDYLFIW